MSKIGEKTVLITGGTGMVGKSFPRKEGYVFVGSKDYDLKNVRSVKYMLLDHRPDVIIHLAACVGGVKANTDYVGRFYSENILINHNVIHCARDFDVKKVVSLLSTCIYPDAAYVKYPLTEDQIHNGPPHSSNFGYAYAKRMLDVQSRAYRKQYGCNYITTIPNNLFGKHDNFDLQNSHVLPAIIRKVYEAKKNNTQVVLWGDGSPLREFTYSNDLAEILLFLVENYNEPGPINVGNTKEISIKQAAEMIAEIFKFHGEIIWDTSKPSGQFRKPSDNSKLIELGWKEEYYTDFYSALCEVCEWFEQNYPNVRLET